MNSKTDWIVALRETSQLLDRLADQLEENIDFSDSNGIAGRIQHSIGNLEAIKSWLKKKSPM